MNATATYSPDDNKLRIYPASRLSPELYARVTEAGYRWAPRQECFIAPAWSPDREDIALEIAGEIEDEDKSLMDRAEERAERFAEYRENRTEDANRAREAVSRIADNIPFGQPILVGHHSERRARKDAERIQNGMTKAFRLWECAEYWTHRASAALRHAERKERPDVRARRIKGLEADKRRQEKSLASVLRALAFWEGKLSFRNASGETFTPTFDESERDRIYSVLGNNDGLAPIVAKNESSRWSAWDILRPEEDRYLDCPKMTVAEVREKSLEVLTRLKVRCDRWLAHFNFRIGYEKAQLEASGGTVADQTQPEKGGACQCLFAPDGAGWAYIQKVNRVSVTVRFTYHPGGKTFATTVPFDKLRGVMAKTQVDAAREEGRIRETGDGCGFWLLGECPERSAPSEPAATPPEIAAMKAALKEGVQVVAAPQLFPTPDNLAGRMAEELGPRARILEPSAGTGNLIRALVAKGVPRERIVSVEVHPKLAAGISARCADFLQCAPDDLGEFDGCVMNPPFGDAQDIRHIQHAFSFLASGGRMVALCANGPRQQRALKPWAEALGGSYEPLPEGAFAEQGTGVNVALIVADKP